MTIHQKGPYCPLLAARQKEHEEVWHGMCTEERCAWWTGKECAVLAIAKRITGSTETAKKR